MHATVGALRPWTAGAEACLAARFFAALANTLGAAKNEQTVSPNLFERSVLMPEFDVPRVADVFREAHGVTVTFSDGSGFGLRKAPNGRYLLPGGVLLRGAPQTPPQGATLRGWYADAGSAWNALDARRALGGLWTPRRPTPRTEAAWCKKPTPFERSLPIPAPDPSVVAKRQAVLGLALLAMPRRGKTRPVLNFYRDPKTETVYTRSDWSQPEPGFEPECAVAAALFPGLMGSPRDWTKPEHVLYPRAFASWRPPAEEPSAHERLAAAMEGARFSTLWPNIAPLLGA